jgi:hypothetical protein
MQHAIPHCGFDVIEVDDLRDEVFLQSLEVRERNCYGSSTWVLRNGGIIDQRR